MQSKLFSAALSCLSLYTMTLCAQEPQGMSPELTSRLGELMDRDWKQRPSWADMAVAILKGSPMGSGKGWFTGAERRHEWQWIKKSFPEAASDGKVVRGEIRQLSEADFDRIDVNRDQRITSDDFLFTSHPQLEDESPVGPFFSRIDNDSNGRLTEEELRRWFARAADGADFLSVEDFKNALGYSAPTPPAESSSEESGSARGPRPDPRWRMLSLLLNGEMGSLTEGPELGEEAPELDLPMVSKKDDGSGLELTDRYVKLADARGKQPIVLIFGSFT